MAGHGHCCPSPAWRHLYLVIAGLDPIGDEEAYLDRIAEDLDGDWDRRADDDDWAIDDPAERAAAIQAKILAAQRARHPLSIRDLVEASGLQPSTAVEALRALLVPMFGNWVDERTGQHYPPIALLNKVSRSPDARPGMRPTGARGAGRWKCEVMNSPERLQQERDRLWPPGVERWAQGQLRARRRNSQRLRRGR